MDTIIMRGKPVADKYRELITNKINAAKANGRLVTLAVVVVGDDPASHVYKNRLVKLIQELAVKQRKLSCLRKPRKLKL